MLRLHSEHAGNARGERERLLSAEAVVLRFIGNERLIFPDGHSILAPVGGQRPPGQLLAGVPFSLAVVQQGARGELAPQPLDEFARKRAFLRRNRRKIPLRAIRIIDRDKRRLAAHCQSHIMLLQVGIDGSAQGVNALPHFFGVGLGHAGRLVDALDPHLVVQLGLAFVDGPADGGRRAGLGRTTEGNMPFARQQTAGRIEPHPARAGQIHFAPGMQVGEIHLGTTGTVQGLDVRRELDQIAAHKTRREAEMPEDLHQQPGGIAARAAQFGQRLFRGLHAGFQADEVFDLVLQALIERHHKINRSKLLHRWGRHRRRLRRGLGLRDRSRFHRCRRRQVSAPVMHIRARQVRGRGGMGDFFGVSQNVAPHLGQTGRQVRREGRRLQKGHQVLLQRRLVGEGKIRRRVLNEKVERIVNRHLGHEFDFHRKLPHGLGKNEAGVPIGEGILLPVDEVLPALDALRIAQNLRPAMRRRAEANHVRAVPHGAVIGVMRLVLQRDVNSHGR